MTDTSTAAPPERPIRVERSRHFFQFRYDGAVKRCIDVSLALLILPTLVPIITILWLIVRLDGGPGLFGHTRVGRGGRMFRCWKIRTMVPNASRQLDQLLASDPEARAEWERDRKLRCDPRVTRLGTFLRETSLDELPQIWNVLTGEMSLIGPRPITVDELERYGRQRPIYLSLRPGVTGLWQVSGRNDTTYDQRIKLDAEYLHRMSPRTDFHILLRTLAVVLRRTGY